MFKSARLLNLCILMFFSAHAFGQQCDVLKVGSTQDWHPVTYIDSQSGAVRGIANDLARLLGQELGIPVEIDIETPWSRMLHNVQSGELDMVSALYWTSERDRRYLYTQPYFVNQARVFVPKGKEFPFSQLADLKGRTGVVPLGGSFGEEFDTFRVEHKLKLIAVERKERKGKMILAGRADYFIHDYLDGISYLKRYDLMEEIVALPHPISTTEVYFAFLRQSPCVELLPRINRIIDKAKSDGTLQSIIDGYF